MISKAHPVATIKLVTGPKLLAVENKIATRKKLSGPKVLVRPSNFARLPELMGSKELMATKAPRFVKMESKPLEPPKKL